MKFAFSACAVATTVAVAVFGGSTATTAVSASSQSHRTLEFMECPGDGGNDDALNNGDAYMITTDDSVEFGSCTEGEGSFTFNEGVTVDVTDDSMMISVTAMDGTESSLALYEDSVVVVWGLEGIPDLTINDPVYDYTNDIESYMAAGGFESDDTSESSDESGEDGSPSSEDAAEEGFLVIVGSTDDCEVYMLAFNADAVINASPTDDCGFVTVLTDNMMVMMTDDFVSFGNEDAYIAMMEDSVMFGSSVTGSNFTVEGMTSDLNEDGDMVLTTDEGTMTFAADGSVSMASTDPDADVLTMMNPVYNYTEEGDGGFVITGDTEYCADFFYAFNADGVMAGSEDCGFLAGVDAEGDGYLATDDFLALGNEDAFIAMTEDSVMFGSSVTGANFTVEGITSDLNEDEELVMSYEGGSSTFASDGSIVYTPTDPDADGFTLMNAVYTYTEEGDGGFVISGNTKDCDDFMMAFNNDGVVSGSEDCGFIAGGNEDGWMYASDDKIAVGNDEGSSEVLLDFGDDDGSCKTIRELLCESPAADSYTTVCELWTNSETVKANEGVSMTVFVPTDDAFATLNDLLDQADVVLDSKTIEKILMFHATPGMVMSTDLDCTGRLDMFGSGYSRTKCGRANKVDYLIQKGSGNRKNDMEPIIIAADIMACDESVIHIVSEVMLPNFIEDLA